MRRHGRIRPRQTGGAESLRAARSILEEMVWTTRCVICDRPGQLLCGSCRMKLPYIDRWQACPRCGAPGGRLICTECNRFALRERGLERLPYRQCTSVLSHDDTSRRIVTAYKDSGEQRLAGVIAAFCADAVSPSTGDGGRAVTYIPSSKKALTRRGFDHARLTAAELSARLGMPLIDAFARPHTRDQRELDRKERQQNMRSSLKLRPGLDEDGLPERILLYDDVYTTGATLCAASEALRRAGCEDVACITFTRVV